MGERQTKHGPTPVKEQRPHPENAPIVVEIFDRIAHNESIHALVADLSARGGLAPARARWHCNSVQNMIPNVSYIGKRSRQGNVYDGTWAGPVTSVVFRAAVEIVTNPTSAGLPAPRGHD